MTIKETLEQREKDILSPFACLSAATKGREKPIKPCELRTNFQRDRDKIIHSNSFRRLKHKTQVFLSPQGDHYRTRLTHTLEVSQIGRTIARALSLNEDLVEAAAMGHDLGHTPFGHAGEEVLNRICPHGFVHSAQSVRVVEFLELDGKGLNLTWEVRNAIACHSDNDIAATLEGRIVKYADKIAYMNHDIEDAVRAKIIKEEDIPWEVRCDVGRSKSERITTFITNIVENSVNDIIMDETIKKRFDQLREFMFAAVYTNPHAKSEELKAKDLVARLYEYYVNNVAKMPCFYREIAENEDKHSAACDYVASMTDRFAMAKFEELFIPRVWGI